MLYSGVKKYLIVAGLISGVFSMNVAGQSDCNETLIIEENTTICLPAEPVQLNAIFSGLNIFEIQWSPWNGLSNTSILDPTANVTETTTYTLTVKNEIGENLIFNGDFELGNIGFTTAYVYNPTNLVPEGVYAITPNPGALHPSFPDCSDMGGGGNMMAVNGAGTPNTLVWCQTVPVDPDSEYNFSAWVSNIITQSPAQLQFSANGELLGPVFSATGTCNWMQFNATWYSGSNTSVNLCVVNQNTAQSGNDFNLDDIEFRKTCTYTAEVTITVLESVTEEIDVTICHGDSWFAGGGQQSSSGIYEDYFLSANGCDSIIVTHLTVLPEIPVMVIDTIICEGEVLLFDGGVYADEGTHEIIYQTPDGCDSLVQINLTIAGFGLTPGAVPFLNCFSPDAELSLSANDQNQFLIYSWSTSNGNIVTNNWSSIVVDQAGEYEVEVFYQNGNVICGHTIHVFGVEEDFTMPQVILETIGDFECGSSTMQLTGENSIDGDIYHWQVISGGDILTDQNNATVTINGPGTYLLEVTNAISQCTAVETIVIEGDPSGMNEILIDSILPITCADSTVFIDAGASFLADEFFFEWHTVNGNIVSGEDTWMIEVDLPGEYFLILKDVDGNCSDTTVITIPIDTAVLEITVAPVPLLTCIDTTTEIQISVVPIVDFEAIWRDTLGVVLQQGQNLSTYNSNTSGIIHVEVISASNGCVSFISIPVMENSNAPSAHAGDPVALTCVTDTLQLMGSADDGQHYTYMWSTVDGNILSGDDGLTPWVDLPGSYLLQVTDTLNGCTAEFQTAVLDQRNPPHIQLDIPEIFTCNNTSIELDGTGSDAGAQIQVNWMASDGTPVQDSDSIIATVFSPGVYLITLFNQENGCSHTDSIEVVADTLAPLVNAGMGFVMNCLDNEFILDGSLSDTGSEYSVLWSTTNGNIIDGENTLTPTINSSGTYLLTIENNINGCQAIDSVIVQSDENAPEVMIDLPAILNCQNETVFLNAIGSSSGGQYQFFWNTTEGNIVDITPPYIIEVNAPGAYSLEILNTDNQCRSIATAVVLEDRTVPQAHAGTDLTLDCNNEVVTPQADGSSQGNRYIYAWTTSDGQIDADSSLLTPVFSAVGVYNLMVTDTINHCTAEDEVVVGLDTIHPIIQISTPESLTCTREVLELDASGSTSGVGFNYLWTSHSGQILSDVGSLNVDINRAGWYVLQIINTENGCASLDSVLVEEAIELPSITLSASEILTCRDSTAMVLSEGSSSGSRYVYLWTSNLGQIVSPPDMPNISVGVSSWYVLTIEDLENGCINKDSVYIDEDKILPIADAGMDKQLTCKVTEMVLQGMGDAQGQPTEVLWTTVDGQISGPDDRLEISAIAAGTYMLTVINTVNGCESNDEVMVLPNMEEITGFTGDLVQPDCFRSTGNLFIYEVEGGSSPYRYALDQGDFVDQGNFTSLLPGMHTLFIEDVNGCKYDIELEIFGLVPVEVSLEPVHTIELGESINLHPELNKLPNEILEALWLPQEGLNCYDCLEPVASPIENQRYTIQVTDLNGCISTAQTSIIVDTRGGIYVPNSFSPSNADGINDYFTIYARMGFVRKIDFLEIFDRWGNKVFFRADFPPNEESLGWDGTFRSRAVDPGVYVYSAVIELINGLKVKIYGDVTLYK